MEEIYQTNGVAAAILGTSVFDINFFELRRKVLFLCH